MPGSVGVTGHRLNRLPPPLPDRLAARLRALYGAPHPECRLMSCLADGTDLIGAENWPADRELIVLLPVAAARWRHILDRAPDRAVFDRMLERSTELVTGTAETPNYEQLATRLVAMSDRVLAVWDGAPGRPGGTGSVVAAARAAGKPVLQLRLVDL